MVKIITVVRDRDFYNRCVKNNPYNDGAELIVCDNTKKNIGIPTHYNKFLDNYDFSNEDWLVFCHEDWEPKEHWLDKLNDLDKNSIYGTLGTKLYMRKDCAEKRYIGSIGVSHKDGSGNGCIGFYVETGTEVETFDCMAIIIHSSLIKKYNIRFDENLDWHHYAEELCIRLREQFNIKSRIFQMDCKHWSYGAPLPNQDFDRAYAYVKNKFQNTQNVYSNTTTDTVIGPLFLPVQRVLGATGKIFSLSLNTLLNFPLCRLTITPDKTTWYFHILNISIFHKYLGKFRLYLLFIPILKIRWDDVFGIYLFDVLPIIKFKKRK